ncbi:right-handed parallel beta-helix repeat-containing protein (plasmid) [Halorussus salilacus]|uniref:right-handed parallel beta-helix repeat-containing protein n=1 Tax=Halorussus salilacus TaxID=2953750 RepID=UPI00209E78F9|nr:right-handed parallel beta-helix repeat-containing protein [Halorussus salilacus]USZ69844.1 right-handed parallel beta-helix repeat-containing protein [Halorussus salilacus]
MTARDARTLGVLLAALAVLASVCAVPAVATLGGVATAPTDAQSTGEAEPTPLDSCTTIEESGTYVLTDDIENGGKTPISESCFEIRADDVTVDGDGHEVAGRGESHTDGVAVVGADGVTVRNVEVHDWHNGVVVENGSASVREVTSHANAYGIRLENAGETSVEANTVEDNLVGIYAEGEAVSLGDNDLSGNEIPVQEDAGNASTRADF